MQPEGIISICYEARNDVIFYAMAIAKSEVARIRESRPVARAEKALECAFALHFGFPINASWARSKESTIKRKGKKRKEGTT